MSDYVLYILMRSDMVSLNPGKAMAQAAHAANQFAQWAADDKTASKAYHNWRSETGDGFGTTIVLDVINEKLLLETIDQLRSSGLIAGVVNDPTYPVTDGAVTHLLPINTCGFVFLHKDNKDLLSQFSLHY